MTRLAQERHFAIVPKAVLYHPELNGNDIRVYASLSERAGRKRHAWPGVRTIAADLGMSPTTVQGSVERLEASGVVEVERRQGMSNDYWLPEVGVTETGTAVYQKLEQGVPETDTELDPITRPIEVDAAAASSELPAIRWARRWADLRQVGFTQTVKRNWAAQVQELIAADVSISEGLLQQARREGIREPKGWAYVAGAVHDADELARVNEWMST